MNAMKWWWRPRRKREWLQREAAYWSARFDLYYGAPASALDGSFEAKLANCESLKPAGWTRDVEARRWNSFNPRPRRWTA